MLFKFKGDTIFSVDTTIVKSGNFIFEGKEFLDDISIITAGNYPDKVKSAEVVLDRGISTPKGSDLCVFLAGFFVGY